jgi:hypothetical protein
VSDEETRSRHEDEVEAHRTRVGKGAIGKNALPASDEAEGDDVEAHRH